jgi:chemotaxis protein CheD
MDGEVVNVGMAGVSLVNHEGRLKAILGSCVGIIIHDPQKRVSALAHVMLPRSRAGDASCAKYADTAVPDLIARLTACGSRRSALEAYLVGGAQMFATNTDKVAPIGDQNVAAARQALRASNVPITFEDTGGNQGRTVTFDNATGQVSVRTLRRYDGHGGAA